MSNTQEVKRYFPIFLKQGREFHYLDNANTSQKPDVVINAMNSYYEEFNANIHRGVYQISERATAAYESTRDKIASFLGGVPREEIVFTSGTTEGLNLLAYCLGESHLHAGDEVVLSVAEHHSNIVPWQILAKRKGITLKFIPLLENGRLDLDAAYKLLSSKKVKIISLGHISNVTGIINPIASLLSFAKNQGVITIVDGAQAVPHLAMDLSQMPYCDFYVFSSHKMCGPTGAGILFGRKHLLEAMPPYRGGGDMIKRVTLEGSQYQDVPYKFEAGTPSIASIIGLGEAASFLSTFDRESMLLHEQKLGMTVYETLKKNKHIRIPYEVGEDWTGIVTFYHTKIHPHDLAQMADEGGVCIRAGHHCAQPLMQHWGMEATSRVSPYFYNDEKDIEKFFTVLEKAEKLFC